MTGDVVRYTQRPAVVCGSNEGRAMRLSEVFKIEPTTSRKKTWHRQQRRATTNHD